MIRPVGPKTSRQLDREIEEIDRERGLPKVTAASWAAQRRPVAEPDPGLVITANRILASARHAHQDYRFGKHKVFLSAIVDVHDPVAMAILDDCRRAGLLKFARADYVAGMDPDMVAESEWAIDGRRVVVHFLEI